MTIICCGTAGWNHEAHGIGNERKRRATVAKAKEVKKNKDKEDTRDQDSMTPIGDSRLDFHTRFNGREAGGGGLARLHIIS
jgi:hypothetical protein